MYKPVAKELGIMLTHAPVSIIKFNVVAPSRAATSRSGESGGAVTDRRFSLMIEMAQAMMT